MAELEQLQQIITSLVVKTGGIGNAGSTVRGDLALSNLKTNDHLEEVTQNIKEITWVLFNYFNLYLNDNKRDLNNAELRRLARSQYIIRNNLVDKQDDGRAKISLPKSSISAIISTVKIIKTRAPDVPFSDILEAMQANIKHVENAQLFIFKVVKRVLIKEPGQKGDKAFKLQITACIKEVVEEYVDPNVTNEQDNNINKEKIGNIVAILNDYFKIFFYETDPSKEKVVQQKNTAESNLRKIGNVFRNNGVLNPLYKKEIDGMLNMFAPSQADIPDDPNAIPDDVPLPPIHLDEPVDIEDLELAQAKALELTRLIHEVKDLSDTSTLEPQDLINIIPERLIKLSNDIPHAIQRKFS